jgi:hypothetical protein
MQAESHQQLRIIGAAPGRHGGQATTHSAGELRRADWTFVVCDIERTGRLGRLAAQEISIEFKNVPPAAAPALALMDRTSTRPVASAHMQPKPISGLPGKAPAFP